MLNGFSLRQISYTEPSETGHTAFAAMTDAEFAAFQATEPYCLQPYANCILYVLPGETPSEEECKTALEIFARVYGNKAVAR